MGARWYDPETRRFLGTDPVPPVLDNLVSFNPYVYGENNPNKYRDPNGEIGVEFDANDYIPAPSTQPVNPEHYPALRALTAMSIRAAANIDEVHPSLQVPWMMWLRGIFIHSELNRMIKEANQLGYPVHGEVSYKDRKVADYYGQIGSVRIDVIYGKDVAHPIFSFDLKTGAAQMSVNQYNNQKDNLPRGTPIYQFNVDMYRKAFEFVYQDQDS